jgi:carbonic anhydrase
MYPEEVQPRRGIPELGFVLLMVVVLLVGCQEDGGTAADKNPETSRSQPQARKPDEGGQSVHHYFHTVEQPHKVEWGYEGELGPTHWGDRSPAYILAKTGKQQSPIDISHPIGKQLPKIVFDYHLAQINLVYNGHTIEEVEERGSFVEFKGARFELLQFHFHSPSEHTVGGKHFDMEMHLVHKSAEGKVAVVAVLIQQGQNNTAYETIWDYLPTPENRERVADATVDATALLPENRDYFHYDGSFTTPPCTEGVLWLVLKQPVELSTEQITVFRQVIQGNNRPVQPLNGREIELSK